MLVSKRKDNGYLSRFNAAELYKQRNQYISGGSAEEQARWMANILAKLRQERLKFGTKDAGAGEAEPQIVSRKAAQDD